MSAPTHFEQAVPSVAAALEAEIVRQHAELDAFDMNLLATVAIAAVDDFQREMILGEMAKHGGTGGPDFAGVLDRLKRMEKRP